MQPNDLAFVAQSVEKRQAEVPPVCLVGSSGKMGAMLSARLQYVGYAVVGIDRKEQDGKALALSPVDVAEALAHTRLVLLCVPVTAIQSTLGVLTPYLHANHLLMDITSVKILPMRWMEKAFSGAVVGTHPLFGPTPEREDMRVALVRGRNANDTACAQAEELFRRLSCTSFWTTAEEHDKGVGLAQSLNFAVSASFFCALARHTNIRPFLTPSFKRHKEAARKHLTQDAAMFLEFSAMNPAFPAALESLRGILAEAAGGALPAIADEAVAWYEETESSTAIQAKSTIF